MATYFLRAGHLHTVSRILSASSEAGLTAAPPVPGTSNKGQLRLRATGTPLSATDLDTKLQTGGNPYGYASADYGEGAGAALIWKNSTDASSQYRGYIDTPYLVDVEFPGTYSSAAVGLSTPRTLADGNLGFVYHRASGSGGARFARYTTAGASANALIYNTAGEAYSGSLRTDFVVLPSGRLVAFVFTQAGVVKSYYSDDHGATWALLSPVVWAGHQFTRDVLCTEYVDDMIVFVTGSATGAVSTQVWVSRDGGCSASMVDDAQTLINPRTCLTPSGTILVSDRQATATAVWRLAPGGGLSSDADVTGILASAGNEHPIVCRDDGTAFVWSFEETGAADDCADLGVSLDGGVTWSDAASAQHVYDSHLTTNLCLTRVSCGTWQGRVVMLATVASPTGSDNSMILLTWGGWQSVADKRNTILADGQPYEHHLLALDSPTGMGWTAVVTGAGSTVTNQNHVNFVTTINDYTYWTAPAAFRGAGAALSTRRVRLTLRVNSGGALTSDAIFFRLLLDDAGGNVQSFKARFTTTGFRVIDQAGATIGGDVTVNLTNRTRLLFAFAHDTTPGTSGTLSVWYKQDADSLWTLAINAQAVAEAVDAATNLVWFGTNAAAETNYDLWQLSMADDDNGMAGGFTNPDDLPGRPLGAAADYFLANGIRVGGKNGGGVPGDTYDVQSTYQYGKEAIWRELRPSKKVHSSADGTSWNVVFDAGAGDLFKGDLVALFGTNFRTATLQLNTADSWGAPAVSTALDATVTSGTVGAGNRGLGYVGPTATPNWRPHQWRSDGDAHRWFLDIAGVVYEITDNDEDRLYVEGVDLSAAAGTFRVFGDRMAATLTFAQYRYARLLVGSQQTPAVDNCYHVGTLVFDKRFAPAQLYDHGFVHGIEPTVELFEADSGYRSSARLGPRRRTMRIQWPPIAYAGPSSDLELRIQDFYAALEGKPFVFWQDSSDQSSLRLFRFDGNYQSTNVWGEGQNTTVLAAGTAALTRVDQLPMVEEW